MPTKATIPLPDVDPDELHPADAARYPEFVFPPGQPPEVPGRPVQKPVDLPPADQDSGSCYIAESWEDFRPSLEIQPLQSPGTPILSLVELPLVEGDHDPEGPATTIQYLHSDGHCYK